MGDRPLSPEAGWGTHASAALSSQPRLEDESVVVVLRQRIADRGTWHVARLESCVAVLIAAGRVARRPTASAPRTRPDEIGQNHPRGTAFEPRVVPTLLFPGPEVTLVSAPCRGCGPTRQKGAGTTATLASFYSYLPAACVQRHIVVASVVSRETSPRHLGD